MKVALAGFIALILMVGMLVMWGVGISNTEISLRQSIKSKELSCKNNFDNMFKTIAQVAQVSDQYKETFKEVYPELISGRYKDGNTLMKWVTESNPTFDMSLYNKLVDAIESLRMGFKIAQDELIALQQQHSTMIKQFPASLIVGSRGETEIKLITSYKTEKVYETGKDDDLDVFQKKDTTKKK